MEGLVALPANSRRQPCHSKEEWKENPNQEAGNSANPRKQPYKKVICSYYHNLGHAEEDSWKRIGKETQ